MVGNPANRRVTMFAAAVTGAGLPPPRVHAWRDVLTGGPVPGPDETVRVDSPGEDAEVDRLLRGAAAPAEHGEIIGTAAAHAGFGAALRRIEAGGATLLSAPDDILTMSDKPRCHALLSAAGIPVPPALPPVTSYDVLRAEMRAAGWTRVFVKPSHGSSASGVLALTAGHDRVEAVTSVETGPGGRLFNNLTLRRYDREADVADIVDTLAVDGLHVERWFPKAGLAGRTVDLRVVVIAGEPRQVVVRASRSPLTNLHLGNARGDTGAVRAAAGERAWAAAMETCARVGAAFPGTLMAGVDLMFHAGWRRHAVAEVNAFGDLLPGVLDRGEDTYTSQVRAVRGRMACAV